MADAPRLRMGFEHLAQEHQARLGTALWDAHAAGARLAEYAAGRDLDDVAERTALLPAVELLLPLLADALGEIERIAPEQLTQLPGGFAAVELGTALQTPSGAEGQAVWRWLAEPLPALVAALGDELERWHQS